jgi:dephospho-CoA kinase
MGRCHVALLGGIGSGKSSVGLLLSDRGADVIDADMVGHQVLVGPARDDVIRLWPEVRAEGAIDRARLAEIVFKDPVQLRRLEAATHPHIRERIAGLVTASSAEVVVVEMPVLADILEGRWLRVVVDAPDEIRIGRLLNRGMEAADVRARMSSQPSRVEWLEVADFVIDNSGDESALLSQAGALVDLIDGCADG